MIPLFYTQNVCTALFSVVNKSKFNYRGEYLIKFVSTALFNLPLIVISIFVDLINLPSILLTDEKNFKYKYQQTVDAMN